MTRSRLARNLAFAALVASSPLATRGVGAVNCSDYCSDLGCYVMYRNCDACFGSGCDMFGVECSASSCYACDGGPWQC